MDVIICGTQNLLFIHFLDNREGTEPVKFLNSG